MTTHRRNAWVIAPVLMGFALFGCGGGDAETGTENEPAPTSSPTPMASVENAATINVAVNFTGAAPAAKAIDMTEEKVCADKHSTPANTEEVVVNNGKLQNVFVYVKEGLTATQSAPSDKVTIDQDGCVYKPHVVGVMAGQQLVFKNSDGILHNVKSKPTANRPFNISQPTTMESEQTFASKEVMIPVECNVHGWMKAFVGVLDHPYFAVSSNDGTAKIGNLPPGTYTIEAWHEKYGTKTQSVTVAANETKDITFDFSAATATRVPLGKPYVVPHGQREHVVQVGGGR
jgi:plastocyanin